MELTFFQYVGVNGKQGRVDYSSAVVRLFEVRVGKAKKDLFELALVKKIRHVLLDVDLKDKTTD